MAQSTAQFTTRSYQSTDQPAVLELMRQSLGETATLQRTAAMWRWKHLDSPFGPSCVRVACGDGDKVVGMRAFMRWGFKAEGQSLRAVRAVDTATHPDYRRMGIFSRLTSQVVEDVRSEGAHFIFNTPNNDVLPGYLKLGWRQVARIHPILKVLNYPGFSIGMARGLAHSRLARPAGRHLAPEVFFREAPTPALRLLEQRPGMERLLRQDTLSRRAGRGMHTQRSWDYLHWRYGQHPTIPYYAVFVQDNGYLQGCIIFRTNTRYGMKEVVLSEMLLAEPREDLCDALLRRLRDSVRADYLITYFAPESFHRAALESRGFRPVPKQGMNFTARTLAPDLGLDPQEMASWDLVMGDLELF
ncbi:MAG TPA: GNAT family N-acetyltransferase [Dehalococcoidia bacterium]|nr:GNAT family N-acetyltransferase [Dehalococcoidia bacterium]